MVRQTVTLQQFQPAAAPGVFFHPIEAQQGLFDRVMRTFGLRGEILTESLILAQDERWRRA